MPTFINPFHANPALSTMKLTEALCNQRPPEVTLYAYSDTAKRLDAFAHIPTVSDDEMARIEDDEAMRRELSIEQRIAIHEACREFADELQDAEAEAGMAALVWSHDIAEMEFSNPQIIGASNGR